MTNTKKVIFAGVGLLVILLVLGVLGILVSENTGTGRRGTSLQYGSTGLPARSNSTGFAAPAMEEKSLASPEVRTQEKTDRLVIKTGSLSLVVNNVRESVATITTFVEQRKGFVVSSNVQEGDSAKVFGTVTARVPAKSFDDFFAASKGLAKKVRNEYVTGHDVTEEYHDVEAELRNRRVEEQQFLKILADAKTIEETLAVTREISRVRREIDRVEGRRKYLEQNVALATLTISLATDEAALPVVKEDEWRPLVSAKNALRGLVQVLKGFSYFIIWIVVFAVLWVPLVLLWKYGRRWWKRRNGGVV